MKNRGQAVAQIVMWGAGVIATGAFAFAGYVSNKVNAVEKSTIDNNTSIVQRVTATETENAQFKEDIKEIKMLLQKLNDKIK